MIDVLPTIIAKTYSSSKRDPRMTKDYQYFTVEYSLGVLCALGYSVLEAHPNVSSPKYNQDYSKMSMGLWLSLLRSLCVEMKTLSSKDPLVGIFQKIESLGILESVAQFVTKRNHDMHGNPISQSALEDELRQREALMEPILRIWQDFTAWRFVFFDNIIFEDGHIVYLGTQLHGENPTSIELSSTGAMEAGSPHIQIKKHELYFVNVSNIHQRYTVSPLLVWSFNSVPPRMSVFSKSITRGTERLEYNSTQGPVRLVLEDLSETPLQKLRASFYTFLYRYNPSRLRAPEVEAAWSISQTTGVVDTDRFDISLEVRNQSNDCTLHHLKINQIFSAEVSVEIQKTEGVLISCSTQEEQTVVEIQLDQLDTNESILYEVYGIRISEQGHYQLPKSQLTYDYSRITLESEDESRHKDSVEIQGQDFEVTDPNSATPFRPILNTNLYIRNTSGIDIGDHFELVLEIENIGFAIANEVDLELVLPDDFVVMQGQKIIETTIQSREVKSFSMTILCWTAGVYNIFLRDVSYTGVYGKRFVSSSTRGTHVLIQSNKRKALEYSIIEAYEDLYLESHEEDSLRTLFSKTPNVDEESYRRMERNIRRRRILDIFETKFEGYAVEPEEVVSKDFRELVYSVHNIPIFGVRLEVDGVEVQDTVCFGLRTFMRKGALHKEPIVPHLPFCQEWISYEEVAKDKSYRDNFFYAWFAGMDKSLKQVLRGRQLMQQLMLATGGDSIVFDRNYFSMHFVSSDAEMYGFRYNDIAYVRVDTDNYLNHHIIFRLPNTNLELSSEHRAKGYQYYTGSLHTATRRTASVGFSIVWKKNKIDAVKEECLELWHLVMKEWSRSLCSTNHLGGAKAYMDSITACLRPMIPTGLRLLRDVHGLVWLYSLNEISSWPVDRNEMWGYIRCTGKSKIYIGIRCRKETEVPDALQKLMVFHLRDGFVTCEWKINGNAERLPEILDVMRSQHQSTSPFVLPDVLFDQWMQYVTYNYGYIVYKLLELLQQDQILVTALPVRLQMSRYRVNRLVREMISDQEDRIIKVCEGIVGINSAYRLSIQQWLNHQKIVQADIKRSLEVVKEKLEQVFPKADGWIVSMPWDLRLWRQIEIYKSDWCYGINTERKMAIALFVDRAFFNRITSVGIVGRFERKHHRHIQESLHQIVQSNTSFQEYDVKRSEWWPAYLGSKHIPKPLQDTGGSQWKYTTEESKIELATYICDLMGQFKPFETDILQTVYAHDAVLDEEWSVRTEKMYQLPRYQSLAITEKKLDLVRLTLAKDLPSFTNRLLSEDWSFVNQKLAWSHESTVVQLDAKANDLSRWGRKGILLGNPSWKPGIFVGCMIDGTDHREPVIDEQGGADLAIVVTVHRKAGAEGVSGNEFVSNVEWQKLIERLLAANTKFTAIDHLQRSSVNRWHPLHLRIPLSHIWTSSMTREERYQEYLSWLKSGLELLMQGGELEALISSYDTNSELL